MPVEHHDLRLPDYDSFADTLSALALPFSISELHGILCGYLCAGAGKQGENYLRALSGTKKDERTREIRLALFSLFSISQEQIGKLNFEFQLLLPDDNEHLSLRAKAFSEWCEGFVQGITLSGVKIDELFEEESQDALQHITAFGELDYDALEVNEEDEQALMEVTEYTRMAVLRLYADLVTGVDDATRAH